MRKACFVIWASGITREGNHVGVHRIYYLGLAGQIFGQKSGPDARAQYQQAQAVYQAYMDKLEVPRTISDVMWATEFADMHYLTEGELKLMQSAPYLEEHTLARCGPDRSTHMSPENNWTATQDIDHVRCYQGILKEFMLEGATKYLAATGNVLAPVTPVTTTPQQPTIVPPSTGPETPAFAGATSLWLHNGSTMYLVVSPGGGRKMFYGSPRPELLGYGIKSGTLIFDGKRVGTMYVGKAYRFPKECDPVSYEVKGPISHDEKTITLRGIAPIIVSGCDAMGYKDDELVFEHKENVAVTAR